jgi:zinc and cadmium transporter
MEPLPWIIGGSLLMAAIALIGSVTLVLSEATRQRVMLPLVAFAAGSLIGGALLHMIPAALDRGGTVVVTLFWVLGGFIVFFALEQFVHWHHCHRAANSCKEPLTYLILVGDGLHNFLGGLAVASTFLVDIRLGIVTWLAAAAHEVPQELGDFAVLVHGGWTARDALLFNVLSALTFLVGGLVTYFAAERIDVSFLLPFAAGNFLYIGASDLVPEVNKHDNLAVNLVHFSAFVAGTLTIVAVGRLGH